MALFRANTSPKWDLCMVVPNHYIFQMCIIDTTVNSRNISIEGFSWTFKQWKIDFELCLEQRKKLMWIDYTVCGDY